MLKPRRGYPNISNNSAKPKKEKLKSPLPMRNGLSASRTWLPKCGSAKNATELYGHWDTILEFLIERFPFMTEDVFRERLERGDIVDESGKPYQVDSPYVAERFLFYYREIPNEPVIPFTETLLFKDEHIIVVDKPHFIPVTPTGRYVKESLLSRLKHRFQIEEITPIHRLDLDTAGVILFCCDKNARAAYQTLFQNREVNKTYHAIAPCSTLSFPYTHSSRLVKGEPFFRMQEVAGEPNSKTIIDVMETKGDFAHYVLKPISGKQHQLRVHMASIGCPIVNDPFYPELLPPVENDYSSPLQLLAKSIEFIDPLSGEQRRFDSQQALSW